MIVDNVMIVYMSEFYPLAKRIGSIVSSFGSRVKLVDRNKFGANGDDLIITVGGDGTFLRVTHFAGDIPILGVNADVKKKEGYYCRADSKNFRAKFKKLISGDYKVVKYNRLKTKLNGKEIETALNEVFIGSAKQYDTARYTIFVNGRKEAQRSSGIIVGTPSGSNAWIKSAGGRKIKQGKRFQFIVREPYAGRIYKANVKKGVASKLKLRSDMEGIVVVDSLSKEYDFSKGSVVEISVGKPLDFLLV